MSKSNSANQCDMILAHLQEFGSITPMEAIRDYGCMRLGARIYDLKRKRGISIESRMESSKNRYGKDVKYARYILAGDKT